MSVVRSIGLAAPRHSFGQAQAATLTTELCDAEGDEARFIAAMHRRSGIDRRGSVIADATTGAGDPISQTFYRAGERGGPTTGARMARYSIEAAALAIGAALDAIKNSGLGADQITHLVTASCTGFDAPGVDVALIDGLGLSPDVRRTHVGFMGCHGAINALRVADALAHSGAVVLMVCVELCTLHMLNDTRPDRVVANALFADGAGALVVTRDLGPAPGWRVVSSASRLVEGTRDAMAWRIGDNGFEMTLAESVPGIVREHLGAWARAWLGTLGIDPDAFARLAWAVHPGGPRVLDAARDALGLNEASVCHSREVLRLHGNMSSPTVLFILDRVARDPAVSRAVMLAFGPGLTIEGALLERV